MLSKSHSVGGAGNFPASHKKKKAPPRPPPPSTVKTSQSFRTASELHGQKTASFAQRPSFSVEHTGRGQDLIDFSTPLDAEKEQRKQGNAGDGRSKEPADYMYRVGASIFYVRSELKTKGASSGQNSANPFSPPRPSAQAMLASPAKASVLKQQSTLYSNVPVSSQGQVKYNPTIIKKPNENNNIIKPTPLGGMGNNSFRSSSGSSDWSDYSQTSASNQQRYGNVPVPVLTSWDEPPRKEAVKASNVVLPTIIKPPTATKPILLPKPMGVKAKIAAVEVAKHEIIKKEESEKRNYYDEPPDSDFDDEDMLDDSIVSPPMPNEPPPPPPPEVAALNDWVNSTREAETYVEPATYKSQSAETDRAYAIVLYDYLSDIEGDLPLQVGDLVYLTKKIDDEWLYGQCAGVEGMFPLNYVNVVVPLPEEDPNQKPLEDQTPYVHPQDGQIFFADALYEFNAETDGDVSLRTGDVVKIFGRLNDDWLYGEVAGQFVGQFPAAFVEPVPSDLPLIPTGS